MDIEIKLIDDPITIKAVEYYWWGGVKKIVFRDLEEIGRWYPEFFKRILEGEK